MYRAYENPYKVKKMLEQARADLEEAIARGADPEDLIYLHEDVAILEERLNFAWQDDEAEMEGYD